MKTAPSISVTFGNKVTEIEGAVFRGCTSLTKLELPEGLTTIGEDAFYGCTSLESVILPESLESIAYNAFRECTSLKEISLPKNLTSIGNNAFCDCSSLTKVTFKGDYPELSSHSFCSVIADGYYPSTWTVTPETSFCQGTFTWHVYEADAEGDEEEAVDEYTYTVSDTGNITITSYNWKNKEVSIPDTLDGYPVVAIGEKAFFENTDLEVLKLPDTITTIGTEAFSGCTGLKEIFFKNDTGLPTIGANAFLNVSANGYHPLTWNISPVSVFYGGTINWENVGTVYLAMSNIAYRTSWSNYIGKELGTLEGGAGSLSSSSIVNSHITEDMNLGWWGVYDQCLSTWTVQSYYNSTTTGLAAVVLQRTATNDVVIAFRGSQSLESEEGREDWVVDDRLMGVCNEMSPQMEDSVDFTGQIIDANPNATVTVTGHSLGGGLALLVSNAFNVQGIGFDSAPTVDVGYYHMWNVMGNSFNGIDKWTYIDYLNEFCPVGGMEVGKKNYVKLDDLLADGGFALDVHARFTIIDYKDGNFTLSDEVSSKIYTTDDEWYNLVNVDYFVVPNGAFIVMPMGSLILGTSVTESLKGDNWKIHTEVLYGGEGNDALYGYNGDDCFIGGPGLDDLYGGNGDDTYVYFKGQGWDLIRDHQGNDTIKLYGFDSSDPTLSMLQILTIINTSGVMRKKSWKFRKTVLLW